MTALQEAVRQGIEKIGKPLPDHCILCSSPKVFELGVYFPRDSETLARNFLSGKTKVIAYCACKKCFQRRDVRDRIASVVLTSRWTATHEIELSVDVNAGSANAHQTERD